MTYKSWAIALTLLGVCAAPALAQRWSLSVDAGLSSPQGGFGKKGTVYTEGPSPATPYQGFAEKGVDVQLQGSYRVFSWLEATVLAGFQGNPFDHAAFSEHQEGNVMGTDIRHYAMGRLLAGPIFVLPLGRVELTARWLGGMLRNFSPLEYPAQNALAWQTGLGLRYAFARRWYIGVNADLVNTSLKEPYMYMQGGGEGCGYYVPNSPGVTYTPPPRYQIPHNAVNTVLGVGFHF